MFNHFTIPLKDFIEQQRLERGHDSFFWAEMCQEGLAKVENRCDNVGDVCVRKVFPFHREFLKQVREDRWIECAKLEISG